ncbi:diamine N-acetyltransferase [Stella humosa]|uniref:Diamine N-acetyltransferase n=1 Tax=Stella humosa TaxID=94 RepID=A0A3N1KU98_9PROT|nr:GNAT family N-acetyltransferase [Stella humosa]ROP84151.1 diamine N-acetyltransferase [Stella humosa]BBK33661.1 spermidine acetyltransferase [Stella humosa]
MRRPPAIQLEAISRDNLDDVLALRTARDQRRFVADNATSLALAYALPECVPRAVRCGPALVGFVMWALDRDDSCPWIYRLMIDRRRQGRGYGRAAVLAALAAIRASWPTRGTVRIGVHPENAGAITLYRSTGFVERGMIGREILMERALP